MRVGIFSYLPPLSEAELARQIDTLLRRDLVPWIEHSRAPVARDIYWTMWKLPLFGARTPHDVLTELAACQSAHPRSYVRLLGYDSRSQRPVVDVLVHRPGDEIGSGE